MGQIVYNSQKLATEYPDHYIISDMTGLALVRTDDIVKEIATKLNLTGARRDSSDSTILCASNVGAAFKMNGNYSGFTDGGIWQWLTKND